MRKKIIAFILIFTLFASNLSVLSYAISATSAVVMIADTKELLYEKNSEKKMSMASTTKIMTALIAAESKKLDDVVTVKDKMVRVEGTSMGLKPGDKLTLFNIVKGMMLLSGNDAANAVAYYLCGGLEKFAELMNEKAKEIGMKNTHFVTPSGLDDKDHYSTAYDMAILSAHAMKNRIFRSLVCDYMGKVDYVKPEISYTYRNHNRFLTMYDGACGIKTGFTKKSGRCLVTAVEKDGCTVIAVTLNAPDDWNDHIKLYNECIPKIKIKTFDDSFDCAVKVAGGKKSSVTASLKQSIRLYTKYDDIETELLTPKLVYAPIKKGDILGFVTVRYKGEIIGEYPVCANENVYLKRLSEKEKGIIYKIKELFRRFERWLITA